MILIVVLFSGLMTLGLAGRSSVHPGSASYLNVGEVENIECREDQGPDSALDAPAPNRTRGFQLTGSYACHRPVFTKEERNPYIERVLSSQLVTAKRVALGLQDQLSAGLKNGTLAVQVEGLAEPRLRAEVEALYRVEINAVLGKGHLRRALADDTRPPLLTILFQKADVPELMSTARLKVQDAKGGVQWLDI